MTEAPSGTLTCPHCSREVPPGEFCGACGAHLVEGGSGAGRRHAYAAHPGEHVLHLSIVSTLLPHLPHRRSAPFRFAFVAAAVLLVGLGLLRLTGPAIAVAALAVPALYLLYLYEVEVYEDEPAWVIGATIGAGAVLGLAWSLVTGGLAGSALAANVAGGASAGSIVLVGILLPVAAQMVMLAGVVIVYLTRRFYDEALDGFTFGVAGALGFTFTATLANLVPELAGGLFSANGAVANALEVLQRGLLVPLLNGTLTGLVGGALFLRRGQVRGSASHGLFSSVAGTLGLAIVIQALLGIVAVTVASSLAMTVVFAVAAGLVLVWARLSIHHMLLAEANEVAVGPPSACTHCHHVVPRMAFCPHCGIATRATPKSGESRTGRAVRAVPPRPGDGKAPAA